MLQTSITASVLLPERIPPEWQACIVTLTVDVVCSSAGGCQCWRVDPSDLLPVREDLYPLADIGIMPPDHLHCSSAVMSMLLRIREFTASRPPHAIPLILSNNAFTGQCNFEIIWKMLIHSSRMRANSNIILKKILIMYLSCQF